MDGGTTVATDVVDKKGEWKMKFAEGKTPRSLTAILTDVAGNSSAASAGDILIGTKSNDKLFGSSGNDLFYGGKGSDIFSFQAIFGHDVIDDFSTKGKEQDIINFHAVPGINNYRDVMSHASAAGKSTLITIGSNSSIMLSDVAMKDLGSSNFTFI